MGAMRPKAQGPSRPGRARLRRPIMDPQSNFRKPPAKCCGTPPSHLGAFSPLPCLLETQPGAAPARSAPAQPPPQSPSLSLSKLESACEAAQDSPPSMGLGARVLGVTSRGSGRELRATRRKYRLCR